MMKRLILAAFAAVCLLACQKNDGGGVVVRQSVDVTIRVNGVLSGYTPYRTSDFSMSDDVLVRYFLYDPSGKLFNDGQFFLSEFSGEQTVSFSDLSGSENYTLAAFAYCVDGNNDTDSEPAYTISGTSELSTLTVTQEDENAYTELWSFLAYAMTPISPSAGTVTVNLASAVSLVYLSWDNIHANKGGGPSSIYGDYTATAKDIYWKDGETFTWTITVEEGSTSGEVIVKNLSPTLLKYNLDADHNCNIFTGTYDEASGTIVLPRSQNTGANSGGYSIYLEGGREDSGYIYFEDLVLAVGNGTLTTVNYMGTFVDNEAGEFLELFAPGVVFTSTSGTSVGKEASQYLMGYHNNDIMRFQNNQPVFSCSLGEINNNSYSLTPSRYPNSNSIYGWVFLFPGDTRIFGRSLMDGAVYETTPTQILSMKAAKQYAIDLDCGSMELKAWEGTLSGKSLLSKRSFQPTVPIPASADFPRPNLSITKASE